MKSISKFTILLIVLMSIVLVNCKKDMLTPEFREKETENSISAKLLTSSGPSICGTSTVTPLITSNGLVVGNVTVANDANNIYVTYTTLGNWYLGDAALFVGEYYGVPMTKMGDPMPQLFENQANIDGAMQTYNFTIPAAGYEDCYIISANATVNQMDGATIVSSSTAYGSGVSFPQIGTSAMYTNVCKQKCYVGEGCSMSQGFWFSKPSTHWPENGVTVGNYTYTKAEGVAIWNTSNFGGIKDSKKGFQQVATILLSGQSVHPTATIWADVQLIITWLNTLGKLSPTNLPTGNAAVSAAAGRIGSWIDNNHCTSIKDCGRDE